MNIAFPHHGQIARSSRALPGFRRRAAWCVAALLFAGLFAVPRDALAQEETNSAEPFFSVSSRQTYAPSQEPKISIRFRQVDHLDFRVYRVKDPVQFFA